MKHKNKEIVEIYNTIIKQITNKIGKQVNIAYPYGSKNIVVSSVDITERMYNKIVSRRNYLRGGLK